MNAVMLSAKVNSEDRETCNSENMPDLSTCSDSQMIFDTERDDIDNHEDYQNDCRTKLLNQFSSLLKIEMELEMEREVSKSTKHGEGAPGVLSHLMISSETEKYSKKCIVFTAWENELLQSHGFRKGDDVSIFRGGNSCRDCNHCGEGVILMVTANELTVSLEGKMFEYDENSTFSLKHHPSLQNTRRLKAVVREMRNVHGRAYHLTQVVFGETKPLPPLVSLCPKICDKNGRIILSNKNLDASQREAVEFAVNQQDLAVVHGPPGTGKTTTIVEIILQHVKMGKKVLAMAPSNLGVDNLVERLDATGVRVVRIGHPARTIPATERHTIEALMHRSENREVLEDIFKEIDAKCSERRRAHGSQKHFVHGQISELRKELAKRTDLLVQQMLSSADVVLSTLISAHPQGILRYLQPDHFDLTVIDECSQGIEPACYLGLLLSPKLLLAGDHQQLPPTVLNPDGQILLKSLMERVVGMHGDTVTRMLTVQYRMNKAIMTWSSDTFYKGKLKAHPSVENHKLCDLTRVAETDESRAVLLLVDTSGSTGYEESSDEEKDSGAQSRCNEGEASIVLALVKKIVLAGTDELDVAVITPYSRQVKLVRSLLMSEYPKVEVQTVDGFQGREKEAIILTLVRSNNQGEIGFLAEERRLNVAVTRARRHVSVVCNCTTLRNNKFLSTFVDYLMENATHVPVDFLDEDLCEKACVNFTHFDLSKLSIDTDKPKQKKNLVLDEEQIKIRKLAKYKRVLDKFLLSTNKRHNFPSKLSAYDRLLIHEVAEQLGLFHFSEGIEDKRHVVVAKEHRKVSSTETSTQDLESSELLLSNIFECSIEKTPDVVTSVSEQGPVNAVHSPTGAMAKKNRNKAKSSTTLLSEDKSPLQHCTLCGKNVPTENFVVHRLACERKEKAAIVLQQIKQKEKQLEAQKQSDEKLLKSALRKRRKSKSKNSELEGEDEDFDAILASFRSDRCGKVNCQQDTCGLLLQECRLCHTNYCLSHHIPEAHGCGDDASRSARTTLLREGVIYPGSGVPSKLPSATRRAQLQRKLDVKISKLEDARKLKKDKKK